MQAGEYPKKLLNIFNRYKYALIVAVFGIVLLCLPLSRDKKSAPAQAVIPEQYDTTEGVEDKLESLLSLIEGVGDAKVMLTLLSGPESVYADEKSVSSENGENGTKTHSEYTYVVLRGENGGEGLAELKKVYARYKGALVVCRGADDPSVRLAVSEAVRAVTGLGADCITVAKMG